MIRGRQRAVNSPYSPGGRAYARTQAAKPKCKGSGQQARVIIEGDWWVGGWVVCPVCGRGGFKPTSTEKVPAHKDYRKVTS